MRYFIIQFLDSNIEKIKAVIFGDLDRQRSSFDKKFFVASLNEGDTSDYVCLNHLPEYNEETILKVLDNDNWRVKIDIKK